MTTGKTKRNIFSALSELEDHQDRNGFVSVHDTEKDTGKKDKLYGIVSCGYEGVFDVEVYSFAKGRWLESREVTGWIWNYSHCNGTIHFGDREKYIQNVMTGHEQLAPGFGSFAEAVEVIKKEWAEECLTPGHSIREVVVELAKRNQEKVEEFEQHRDANRSHLDGLEVIDPDMENPY